MSVQPPSSTIPAQQLFLVRTGQASDTIIHKLPREICDKIPRLKANPFQAFPEIDSKSFQVILDNLSDLSSLPLDRMNVAQIARAAQILQINPLEERCKLLAPRAVFSSADPQEYAIGPELVRLSPVLQQSQFPVSLDGLNPQFLSLLNAYAKNLNNPNNLFFNLNNVDLLLHAAQLLKSDCLYDLFQKVLESQINLYINLCKAKSLNTTNVEEYVLNLCKVYAICQNALETNSIPSNYCSIFQAEQEKSRKCIEDLLSQNLFYATDTFLNILSEYKVNLRYLDLALFDDDSYEVIEKIFKQQPSIVCLTLSITPLGVLDERKEDLLTKSLSPIAATLPHLVLNCGRPLDSLAFLLQFQNLESLTMGIPLATDAIWPFIACLPSLKTLKLGDFRDNLSAAKALENLASCSNLQTLEVEGEKINAKDITLEVLKKYFKG